MSDPLVSVILPTYNRARLLPAAMRSVLNQSYRDLELLVVDDASTDATPEVVRAVGDPRVRYFRQPKNTGAAAARNRGIAEARGELIAFQDSDDEWLAGKLAWQVARLQALPAEVALTQAAVLRFQDSDKNTQYFLSNLPQGRQLEAILPCNVTSFTQGWLARTAALKQVGGFDERLPLWEDWELVVRICKQFRVDVDPKPVAIVNDTPGGLTAQHSMRADAFHLILEKHRGPMERYPQILADNLYCLAKLEILDARRARRGRIAAAASLRLNPRRIRVWVLLVTAFAGTALPRLIARLQFRVRTLRMALRERSYRRNEPVST